MSTIGVIFCGFRCIDTLQQALAPWIEARRQGLAGKRWLICAVSRPFASFDNGPEDGTLDYLRTAHAAGDIDHLLDSPEPVAETEARGEALRWLVAAGADTLWQADSDEMITEQQIKRIAAFWEARPHVFWARLSLKNRVFTRDQYLVQPFTPPRLHRVKVKGYEHYRADHFYQDNNVAYRSLVDGSVEPDVLSASVTIPPAVAWIEHLTWLNDERSRRKVAYQEQARGWKCDFAWDDSRGGLIWREGVTPPETARDPD